MGIKGKKDKEDLSAAFGAFNTQENKAIVNRFNTMNNSENKALAQLSKNGRRDAIVKHLLLF